VEGHDLQQRYLRSGSKVFAGEWATQSDKTVVQKLYSLSKGTNVLSMTQNGNVVAGADSLYASAAWDKATNEVILKLINVSGKSLTRTIQLDGTRKLATTDKLTLLKNYKLSAVNSFENATAISPIERQILVDVRAKTVALAVEPYSFSVIRIKVN